MRASTTHALALRSLRLPRRALLRNGSQTVDFMLRADAAVADEDTRYKAKSVRTYLTMLRGIETARPIRCRRDVNQDCRKCGQLRGIVEV